MRRDMELVRAIMLSINGRTDLKPKRIEVDGYDQAIVQRHVAMLYDAKLLEGLERPNGRSMERLIDITDMTWAGHDFLAATQDQKIWNKMKNSLTSDVIDLPLQLMKEIGIALLKQAFKSKLDLPDL